MSQKKKAVLGTLLALITLAAVLAPFGRRRILLAWEKHKIHEVFAKYSPEDIRMLNARPTLITLPAMRPVSPAPELIETKSFIFRVPPPQSREASRSASKDDLQLTYPQFSVIFLPPSSNIPLDNECQKVYHQDLFQHQETVANVKYDDIDAQSDLQSLEVLGVLLSEKATRFPLYVYFTEFSQGSIRGFIRVADLTKQKFHCVYEIPSNHIGGGIYFYNPKGVDPADVEAYMAALHIDFKPPATTGTSSPATTHP